MTLTEMILELLAAQYRGRARVLQAKLFVPL